MEDIAGLYLLNLSDETIQTYIKQFHHQQQAWSSSSPENWLR
jgi:hypothetical protein